MCVHLLVLYTLQWYNLYNISLYQFCDVKARYYGVDNGSQWQQLLDNEHS